MKTGQSTLYVNAREPVAGRIAKVLNMARPVRPTYLVG